MFKGKKSRLINLCLYEKHYVKVYLSLLLKVIVTWPIIIVPRKMVREHSSVPHPASRPDYAVAEQGSQENHVTS